jgi:hypothetical protein
MFRACHDPDRRRHRKKLQTWKSGPETRLARTRAHAREVWRRGTMTGDDEDISINAIELTRDLCRRMAIECQARGISLEDVSVASLYAAHDVAQNFKGDPFAAIEWMRTGLDLMERQLLSG